MSKTRGHSDRTKYKKMPIEDRMQLIETLYVHFPRNEVALKSIHSCHKHAKRSKESEGILIQGNTLRRRQWFPCYTQAFRFQLPAKALSQHFLLRLATPPL